ncbi:MAG: hypothetical protein MZU97_13735 [Bacillus subtilis]|nr:hypothetical protein [Bacillus subtilis]
MVRHPRRSAPSGSGRPSTAKPRSASNRSPETGTMRRTATLKLLSGIRITRRKMTENQAGRPPKAPPGVYFRLH